MTTTLEGGHRVADADVSRPPPLGGAIEVAFTRAETAADELLQAVKKLQRLAATLKKAAAVGDTTRLRSSADALSQGLADVARAVDVAREAWPHGDATVTGYLEGPYTDELIATARQAGVTLVRLDDRIAAFPVVAQVQPGRRAVRIDGKATKGIRPTAVVAAVRARQARPATRPEAFIEELYRAYQFAAHGERARRGVRALDLYNVLTIRAEQRRTYSKAEFVRDLFMLDTSGVRTTRSGARLYLAASTSAKGSAKALVVPTPDGTPRIYHDVRFEEPRS